MCSRWFKGYTNYVFLNIKSVKAFQISITYRSLSENKTINIKIPSVKAAENTRSTTATEVLNALS